MYAREQNRDMLRDFYYSDDRRVESAVLCLEDAASSSVRRLSLVCVRLLTDGLSFQESAAKSTSVKAAQKFFSEDKDRSFEAKVNAVRAVILGALAKCQHFR